MKPETAKSIVDLASLTDLVKEARAAASPDVSIGRPEDGLTIREYFEVMTQRGTPISYTAAKRDLERLAASGEWEVVVAIAPTTTGNKRVVRQSFYRKVKAVTSNRGRKVKE